MTGLANPGWTASVLNHSSPVHGLYTVRLIARTGKWEAAHRYTDRELWDVFAGGMDSAGEAMAACMDDIKRSEREAARENKRDADIGW